MILRAAMALGLLLALVSGAAAGPPADFTLPVATGDGAPFTLSKAKGHYVALHFLLKTECPVCIRHTRSYLENAPKVAGVEHVFIKPDTEAEIAAWAGKVDAKSLPLIHRDADAAIATAFEIPDGYQFHGQSVHFPALVILNPQGREVFRYVGKANTDRYTFEKFEAKMAELTQAKETAEYNFKKGSTLAISGYDPVAYITKNEAAAGKPEVTSTYQGVTYQFASDENRALFAKSPEKYLPTYGGWCATAMAKGEKVEIDPTNFKVTDGRTFLFYKGLFGDAKKDWVKDEAANAQKADAAWGKIIAK